MRYAWDPAALRRYRLDKRLSNEQLGVAIGTAGTTVGKWQQGKTAPSAESVADLATVLGCAPADFFVVEAGSETPGRDHPAHSL
jgi:transcriptional regulator with XRE-family HTH domain